MRLSATEPDIPLLLPPVNENAIVALVQLWKVSVPVPTLTLACPAGVAVSNTPPVVW